MSDPGREISGGGRQAELRRAPFRAWLVTGPAGRLTGFALDFAKALKAHRKSRKQGP